ncbi:unnamed protein product, partial [marine sediment metagenome]
MQGGDYSVSRPPPESDMSKYKTRIDIKSKLRD